jgi:hypothetical protein
LAVLKGDGSSLPCLPVSFAIIAQQGGRLVGWLVGKGKKKKEEKLTCWCLFVWFGKGVRNVRTKNQKEPGTTVVVVVAVVKRGEEARMNE